MPGLDQTALDAAFEPYGPARSTLLDVESAPHPRLPVAWLPIVRSRDPEERKRAALDTWNSDFLAGIPHFAGALRSRLVDVRAIAVPAETDPMLIYAFEGAADPFALWTGCSPMAFGELVPPFFEALPEPARTFRRQVHAGLTAPDAESCGLTPPQFMTTIADWAGCPDGIPGWEENWWEDCEPVDSRRLLRVTGYGSNFSLCVSSDLPAGEAITYSDGHLRVNRFDAELDLLMSLPITD